MSMSGISIETRGLNLFYGDFQALTDVDLQVPAREVTALIGPCGCGKSTLLRVFNRMNDLIDGVRVSGQVLIDGEDIYAAGRRPAAPAREGGHGLPAPQPLPPVGLREHRLRPGRAPAGAAPGIRHDRRGGLRSVLLWDDLKDRLHRSALALSLEQQQRLCIARVLPLKPEVLLMDEPCSALDPIATLHIEELMRKLKKDYTIVIVTHNMQQAARVSDRTGFMYLGKLVEFGETAKIFTQPGQELTENYISGRFG